MGFCVAVNCGANSFRKQKNGGVYFFRLPKDKKLIKKWLINIRRDFKRYLEVIHYSVYFVMNYPLNRTFSQRLKMPRNKDISLIFPALTSE